MAAALGVTQRTVGEWLGSKRDGSNSRKTNTSTPFQPRPSTPPLMVELGEEIELAYRPVAKAAHKQGAKKGGNTAGKGRPSRVSSRETFPKPKQDDTKRTRAQAAAASYGRDNGHNPLTRIQYDERPLRLLGRSSTNHP